MEGKVKPGQHERTDRCDTEFAIKKPCGADFEKGRSDGDLGCRGA